MHRKGGEWMRRSDDSTGVAAVEVGASLGQGRPAAGGERRAMTETWAEIDEITLSAARRGDHLALADLVRHSDPRLRHLAFHLLQGDGSVDDVLQEVYLRAFRGLARFRGHSTLSTWLYRITYNCCLTHLRKSNAGHAEESADAQRRDVADPFADPAERVGATDALLALLRGLPTEQLAAVLLVDACDLSYRQAAKVLGVPASTAVSRVKAARTKILDTLESAALPGSGDSDGR